MFHFNNRVKQNTGKANSESNGNSYSLRSFYYNTATNDAVNPQIELCWNYGWPPYTDYIYIHDIYYGINGVAEYDAKCSEADIRSLLKERFNSIRRIHPNIKGYYIYDWFFKRDPEFWRSLGFSAEAFLQKDAGFIHVADFQTCS